MHCKHSSENTTFFLFVHSPFEKYCPMFFEKQVHQILIYQILIYSSSDSLEE